MSVWSGDVSYSMIIGSIMEGPEPETLSKEVPAVCVIIGGVMIVVMMYCMTHIAGGAPHSTDGR